MPVSATAEVERIFAHVDLQKALDIAHDWVGGVGRARDAARTLSALIPDDCNWFVDRSETAAPKLYSLDREASRLIIATFVAGGSQETQATRLQSIPIDPSKWSVDCAEVWFDQLGRTMVERTWRFDDSRGFELEIVTSRGATNREQVGLSPSSEDAFAVALAKACGWSSVESASLLSQD